MIHSLAHALIKELTFFCGYGTSLLRERLYCNQQDLNRPMDGFLIYTASGDSEGTLGELVAQDARILSCAISGLPSSWTATSGMATSSPFGVTSFRRPGCSRSRAIVGATRTTSGCSVNGGGKS